MYYIGENQPSILLNRLKEVVRELQPLGNEALMFFLGEESELSPRDLYEEYKDSGLTFFGAMFPGLIYEGQQRKKGMVVSKFPLFEKPILIEDLNNLSEMDSQLSAVRKKLATAIGRKTALIMIDGLADNIDDFLAGIYNIFANSINYIGGGAGSLSLKQQPCVFCNRGIFENCGLIVPVDLDCGTGVKHGWQEVYSPFIATSTEGNKIRELNWEPAFEVYSKLVCEDLAESGKERQITRDNFFEIAKGYPFGIVKENEESIVRDPIAIDEVGNIVCVGNIPQNAVLDILKGDADKLIKAAGEAVTAAVREKQEGLKVKNKLILDCISRVLFLEENFSAELEEIRKKSARISDHKIAGALTIGEISSQGRGYIELYNKTTVAGVFYG